jgi:arylsulfatase A-like enzyme
LDTARQRAYELLTSPALREAVRLDREPVKLRDAYGRNIYGQSILLARRLLEAGTRVVCMSWAPDANATWDTHGSNFVKLKRELLPQLDAAVSTLLEDLAARGRLERTLVAVLGDFGRTPRINGNNAGRDHWNFCYSVLLAGGGIRAGYVHGASDKIGARPSLHPVTPADLIATIYTCLGIPPDLELYDRLQRPLVVCPWGNPISAILS